MAKKANIIKDGTKVSFTGYDGDDGDGVLEEGDELVVVGYDSDEETYQVEVIGETDEDGEPITDSLFAEEFEVIADDEGTKKPVSKTAAAKKKASAKADKEAEEEVKKSVAKKKPAAKKDTAKKQTSKKTAASKAKADAEDDGPQYAHKFKKTQSVNAALKANSDPIEAVAKVIEEREHAKFTIGGLLAYIKRQKSFLELIDEETGDAIYTDDRNGFHNFVRDQFDIQGRNAEYLVDIYETLSQFVTEAQIGKIGWTKLRELLPARALFTDKDTVLEWLDFSRNHTTAEVKDKVKTELVESGVETHGNTKDSTKTSYKLSFFDDQHQVIQKAIDLIRDEQEGDEGEMTDSECFFEIASRFLMAEGAE